MAEKDINMNAMLDIAKQASTQNDETLRDITLGSVDNRILKKHEVDTRQKAVVQMERGNDDVAMELDEKAERALKANELAISNLKYDSELLLKNLQELPILLIEPNDMLKQLNGSSPHMLRDAELVRMHKLGFSDDEIRLMAAGETQMRNHLNARLETIGILKGQADIEAQLDAQDPSKGMSLDAWDKRQQLEAEHVLYIARLNVPKYKDEASVMHDLYENRQNKEQNLREFLQEQQTKTLEKKVDFSHADRLREAYYIASLAKHM